MEESSTTTNCVQKSTQNSLLEEASQNTNDTIENKAEVKSQENTAENIMANANEGASIPKVISKNETSVQTQEMSTPNPSKETEDNINSLEQITLVQPQQSNQSSDQIDQSFKTTESPESNSKVSTEEKTDQLDGHRMESGILESSNSETVEQIGENNKMNTVLDSKQNDSSDEKEVTNQNLSLEASTSIGKNPETTIAPAEQPSTENNSETLVSGSSNKGAGENIISNSAPLATAVQEVTDNNKGTSLSLLAQYETDSDSDVCEVLDTRNYQNRVVEIKSDSDDSSDIEVLSETRSQIDLAAVIGEEDEEENIQNARTPKVKGEFQLDDLPPIQDLHITVPEEECTELGRIQSIVEQLVIVNALPGTVPLDLDTVIFLDKGKKVLGEIFDVLGQVSEPLYCVRFNSNKEIKEKGIEVGQTVYVAPRTEHTQFVILANLMKMKGSDASWENDIEPPEKHLEYSDDEEERSARRPNRNKNRPMEIDDDEPKRQRFGGSPFPNRGGFAQRRPYRVHYSGQPGRQPHHPPPSNYDISGNSWHSNYYQNPTNPGQSPNGNSWQPNYYQRPMHPRSANPAGYRFPENVPHIPPPTNPGIVINPCAVYPPPLMQQPLFPPPLHQPPPPPQ